MSTDLANLAAEYQGRFCGSNTAKKTGHKSRVLWGVASTGFPHLGYLPYLRLLRRLALDGWEVVVLISEFHAYLDDQKTGWSKLQEKYSLYRAIFQRYFGSMDNVRLISGSELYLNGNYFLELMRHATKFPADGLVKSGDQMLRSKDTKIAELLYVYTMMFDVVHLKLDLVICGEDEAGVYEKCLELLKDAGDDYPSAIYLPLMSGLAEPEMHASSQSTNILRLDATTEQVRSSFDRFRSYDWNLLTSESCPLAYLQKLTDVFSPELRSQWGSAPVSSWIDRACVELEQHLALMRYSF